MGTVQLLKLKEQTLGIGKEISFLQKEIQSIVYSKTVI